MLLDELVDDAEKKAKLMSEVAECPEVREVLRWYVENVVLEDQSFAKRMFTFATMQGILFTVPFIMFSLLEKQNPTAMAGFMKANNLIWRDEQLNLSFSCILFEYIDDRVEEHEAVELVEKAVALVKGIFLKALPVSSLGIDSISMGHFIESSADILMTRTKHEPIYKHEKTPFDWIADYKDVDSAPTNVPTKTTTSTEVAFDADF